MTLVLPKALQDQYRLYIEPEKQCIHILDLQVRKIAYKRVRLLIQLISIANEILDMSWSWFYYGDGEANLIESKSNVGLPAEDSRLYSFL